MLSFPLTSVRAVIARGRADAEANGGFRDLYYGLRPGKDEKPGLWLVGDHGVYLMSNGKLLDGAKPLVVYAEECDPSTNDDWFDVKRRTFGGDDGVDFIDAEQLEPMMAAAPEATHLRIAFHQDSMQLTLIAKS
ncbi:MULTISPECIES: DUF3085 domain-containing protein [Rhizobium/Agrobacterium group]|uniref:DUF3085 domain-containing protein n=4 Tax=Agrobacterium TaxID=357 RepID=A0A9X3R1U1_9HYPH|nr:MULTISPECIES: DUF3085 domain-containing protein [Rhizobium/Agrobacterium group]MBO9126296.1 DUF3085 domain-containing protein [Rhizobium sp. 16-488-2b]MBO9176880.1 DUF3085 domain-containing protein [Rhizobium sp. 16-488-2a]MBO9197449.1 DUF3085 domain-containing protein [Rhizobium sp. 16-449-1b]MCZ7472288.1 DUF3085 domain-containing protein [Rhizobium rhizogenes]MCZ7483315.1 DUF3085 domain-containing protein [Rhizobium rhizogenes]